MKKWKMLLLIALILVASAGNALAAPSPAELYVMIQELQALTTGMQTTINAQQATIASLSAQLGNVESRVAVNEHQLVDAFSVLNGADFNLLTQLAPYVSVDQNELNGVAGPHVIFSGVNVHFQSGSGETNGTPNGLGNVLIGYNEVPETLLEGDRGGSHNLIMGREHKFLSNDSILHGWGSTANAHAVAILGGDGTVVNSSYSVAAGGMNNTINSHGVVLGGEFNVIDGNYSVIVGGQSNRTIGQRATVTGGHSNTASGNYSSVSGGVEVQAVNDYSWAAGALTQ